MSTLIQDIKINSVEEAEEILKAAGTEDLFEKAHNQGEVHPNGKWVWSKTPSGYDWRTIKQNKTEDKTHKVTEAFKTMNKKTILDEYDVDLENQDIATLKNKYLLIRSKIDTLKTMIKNKNVRGGTEVYRKKIKNIEEEIKPLVKILKEKDSYWAINKK